MTPPPDPAITRLTPKERECLSRWLGHATAKEIALDLGISHHAVEKRLKAARQKLGVATSLEAARLLEAAESYGSRSYGQAASQSPELVAPPEVAHIQTVGGTANSQSSPSRRRHWITGATIMSLALLAALALSTSQPAEKIKPEVVVIDQPDDAAGQLEAAADKAFARLDRDGSGVLENDELAKAKVRTIRSTADVTNGKVHTIRIDDGSGTSPGIGTDPARADINTDGQVTRDEYRQWMSALVTKVRSMTEAVVEDISAATAPKDRVN